MACSFLIITFVIVVITVGVIIKFKELFNSIQRKYENAEISDQKKFFNDLDKNRDKSGKVELKLTTFDKEINKEVTNLITEHNIEEEKINSMNIFINSIINLINNAGKAGENISQNSFDLYGGSIASLYFKYNKEEHKITLAFSFYDEKLFEYLKLLIEMINKKGYNLQKKTKKTTLKHMTLIKIV